ncbi:MAG: hypothetical protein U5N86_13545 [Planctomycetota bacterium]|nr:hypothetical protein [Planctomycetota bacterium]
MRKSVLIFSVIAVVVVLALSLNLGCSRDMLSGGATAQQSRISVGIHHTLCLDKDGSLWAWGSNSSGQIGNGEKASGELLPVPMRKPEGMGNVVTISAGGSHNIALCEDGSLWAWGSNSFGQIGNGKGGEKDSKEFLPVPVRKPEGMGNVLAISAGSGHNLALCGDGSLWAWGWNDYGQIGNGRNSRRELFPVRRE